MLTWDQGSAIQADPQSSSAWEGLNLLEGSAADVPPAGCKPRPHLIRRRGVPLSSSSGEPFVIKAEQTQRSWGMIHPKQTLNIGQSKCCLGMPLAVNINRACKAVQVECHIGSQEGEITQAARHCLSLCNLSPSLTSWSYFPHPDNFPGPLLVVSQSFTFLQIPAWFPSLPLGLTQVKFQTSPGSCENLLPQQLHMATDLEQQILDSLRHQTCPGQKNSWGNDATTIQVFPSRHVQTVLFGVPYLGQVHRETKGAFLTQRLPKCSVSSLISTACWTQNF